MFDGVADEIARRLQESCSEGLIILPESVAVFEEVLPKLSYKIKVIMTPSVDGKEGRLPQGFLSLSEMLVQVSDDIVFPNVKADDLAVIPFSSGNTGLQKGVCLTHRNIVSNLLQHTHSDVAYLRRAQGIITNSNI
jgi:long-subunit acyl-CoA synthetase (AMP-forming)